MKALDASFSPPNYKQAKTAGYSLAMRYLSFPQTNGKVIKPDEVERIHDAGLALSLNWEHDSHDALRGREGGVADATHAVDQAKNRLKYPKDQVIWYSVGDFDAQPHEFGTISAYLDGVREVHQGFYKIGVYGGAGLLKHLKKHGKADFFWQAVAPHGWFDNASKWSDAHLWQVKLNVTLAGGAIDINEFNTAAGAFPVWANGAAPGDGSTHGSVTPFPLSGRNVFGLISGPEWMHGGINETERSQIRKIQVRLQERDYAPGTAGWADGIYEEPTADAVKRFQADKKLQETGTVDATTWDALFAN